MSYDAGSEGARRDRNLKSVTDERYRIIVELLRRTFNVPIKRRTREEINANLQYWRN